MPSPLSRTDTFIGKNLLSKFFSMKISIRFALACIELSTNEGQFIFEYETTGALTAKLALEQALKELKEHFEEFSSHLEKLG